MQYIRTGWWRVFVARNDEVLSMRCHTPINTKRPKVKRDFGTPKRFLSMAYFTKTFDTLLFDLIM